MKTIIVICLSVLLFAFFNAGRDGEKIEELKHRIIRLESKIDSLVRDRNNRPVEFNSTYTFRDSAYNNLREMARCQALTKKGTQCKRKARNNSFCWQHGG